MDATEAAQGFSAMGSESRLEVLQALVRAGETGLRVGDIPGLVRFYHHTVQAAGR